MPTTENASEFWTRHKLLEPDGPVCLIIKAEMAVAAGLDRFQPAGFPEVGHVIYDAPRPAGHVEKVCIVDSPASMANHLEQVCLAGENDPTLHRDLSHLPHIQCVTDRSPTFDGGNVTLSPDDPRDRVVTTSLTEGHRIASDYFLDAKRLTDGNMHEEQSFRGLLRREFRIIEVKKDKTYFIPPEAWWSIYSTLFRYDPNSLVHGVLFAKEQIKISRVLTAHLEAFGAARVGRSGVKFDRLGRTTSGQPIFGVDEETAREIRATFLIDLALLRSYGRDGRDGSDGLGLNTKQKELLLAFSLWKVRELLGRTFSYRSGCKLRTRELTVTTDESETPLATSLPDPGIEQAISAAGFTGQPVTRVYYPFGDLFKPSKDDQAGGANQDADTEGSESEE